MLGRFLKVYGFLILFCLFAGLACKASSNGAQVGTGVAPDTGVYLGIFRQDAPKSMDKISAFEKDYGIHPSLVMWYQDWSSPFPKKEAQNVIDANAIPHIVWEPWIWGDEGKIKPENIIKGERDEYIRSWAKDVKKFGHPVFIRTLHEFNIEGYPWGIVNNKRDPQIYIQAFRHLVDIFRKEGVTNVKWVWCPMNFSYPESDWNDYLKAYPGNDYVDWIGIDGYNWGSSQSWSRWQSFEDLFREPVIRLSGAFPDKPIMVAEYGSTPEGGNKADFYTKTPGYLRSSLKQIRAICYFDIKKEADWRIASSPETAKAFKAMVADPLFLHGATGLLSVKAAPNAARPKGELIAKQALSEIKIDASLSDWDGAQFVQLKTWKDVETGPDWQGTDDLSGLLAIKWSGQTLYVGAKIYDDKPFANGHGDENLWNGDAIELAFSANPHDDANRSEYDATDFQIGLGIGNQKNAKPTVWEWKHLKRAVKEAKFCVVPMPGGYILEAAIPFKALGNFKPKAGVRTGFNFAFDDSDDGQVRDVQMLWAGNYLFYKDPSVWGTVLFQ